MRSIAVMNQKGGVGKTTTTVNVAAALAREGAKVCLIDIDPQAHATLHFGIDPQLKPEVEFKSVYDLLVGNESVHAIRRQVTENLWILPSHLDLAGAELELAAKVGREMILQRKLKADTMKFDYLLIDCPPSLGLFTINAFTVVEEVFVPIQPHYFSLHGFGKLSDTIETVSQLLNPKLHVSGVIFCMFDAQTRLAMEVANDIQAFIEHERKQGKSTVCSNAKIFETKIRRNIRLAEAPSFGHSIFYYDAGSNGAEDYYNLVREIMGQVKEKNH